MFETESPLEVRAQDLAVACKDAFHRIQNLVIKTPIIRLPWLDTRNREVWAKLECWQKTGSFKIRGAYNALLQLSHGAPVITASAGNHGIAIATVAAQLGLPCKVIVPVNASELKVRRLLDFGIRVIPSGRDLFEATRYAMEEARQTGACYISGYANRDIIAGQGTCIVEIFQDVLPFDNILVPLGGGGLLTGVGSCTKFAAPHTRIIAVYPEIFGRQLRHRSTYHN